MEPIAISRDVLATRYIDEYILVGVGNQVQVFKASSLELMTTIHTCHNDVVHNIARVSDKILVSGGRHLSIFKFSTTSDEISIEAKGSHVFNDWIIAADLSKNSTRIYVLFSHNNLRILNLSNVELGNICCEEKCILYGGHISNDVDEQVLVFSCTVFQEILVWRAREIGDVTTAPVLHRLRGHRGVIFSAFYDANLKLITSTSDDRTIRLWKIQESENSDSKSVEWENAEISLLTTMFGHTARVWKAIIVGDNVISIGEDSLMCIWSLTGVLRTKIISHRGAPVWSISVSPDTRSVITGGGDGAVHIWPLGSFTASTLIPKFSYANKTPKFVSYLNSGALIVFLDGGELLLCDETVEDEEPDTPTSYDLPRFESYCLLQVSPERTRVALASSDGHLLILHHQSPKDLDQLEQKVMESKIFSLQWLSSTNILVCGASGLVKLLTLTGNNIAVTSEFTLPQSREPWTTSALISHDLLLCGDRSGNIIVFDMQLGSPNSPKQILPKIHGRLGVQSLGIFGDKIISTGRDGTLRYYRILSNNSGHCLRPLHWKKMPMEWVARSVPSESDVLILGFKEIEFMMYSIRLDRLLLRIVCGGGHRSWDCLITNETFNFTCIKDKQVHILHKSTRANFANKTLIPGFHSKEIHSLSILETASSSKLFLSASEDCTIRISALSRKNSSECGLVPLETFDGHISNVKTVKVINLEKSERFSRNLVLSGGGRAQLKVWEICIDGYNDVLRENDVMGVEVTSFMLNGTDKNRRSAKQKSYVSDTETRFMDIAAQIFPCDRNFVAIFVACSDGFVRAFIYDIELMKLDLVVEIPYGNRCVLKVHCFIHEDQLVLVSMATDGFVNLWNVSFVFHRNVDFSGEIVPFARWRPHQSGINGFDFMRKDGGYFMVTGGDDNNISFSIFEIVRPGGGSMEMRVKSQWASSEMHSAQVTGVRFIPGDQLLTSAIDQRIVLYDYKYSSDKLSVEPKKILHTFISDLQGLTVCTSPYNSGESLAFVYGQGLEIFQHQKRKICK